MAADRNDKNANTLDDALTRFVKAYVQGEQPDIDEFVEKYPQHEAQIRQRIQSLREIDALFDSIVQTDARDFEEAGAERNLVSHKIGSFEITKMIGRGGMGVVYLAHDIKLKRPVAIKSMPAKFAADSTARMRFRREAELLASLNHPNIAVIHDIIEVEDGTGYLVLEYVPGETLSKRITREPLTIEQALAIGRQIAEAVSAAHKKGIVHRDLKPGNIKITPDGQVKVLDFGLAKPSITSPENTQTTATQHHHIIGTPAYMSPEQARGLNADHRTDIWSFGCIMYEMLTGHLPFKGETATDTLARIIEREPDWQALPEETPANIRTLLQLCLEKDPDQRPGDIAEAITQITETLSAPPTMQPRKLTRTTVIFGAAVITVLSAVGLWFALHEEPEPFSEEIRLVVLPFANLGPAEQEWFADGMTDEITTRLAGIHGLAVISRQSAMQYKNKEIGTQQIAEELNVDYILEGTVQCERSSDPNSQVRIRTQLIKAADDTHVWAQPYDNDMRNIFRLQSDVAEKVAQALDITLLEPERQALASELTENTEAYNYYLRGNEYFNRSTLEADLRMAIRMYEKAIELDPVFAPAYARLAMVHVRMYWYHFDRREEHLEMARQVVNKALELGPELPSTHGALGIYYYQGLLDYDRALEQFEILRKSLPSSSGPVRFIGAVQRRQGKFEQALANFERAYELDPLSLGLANAVGETLLLLRRYPQAEHYFERAISLAPDLERGYVEKAWLYLLWEGSTKKARAVLEEGMENIESTANYNIVSSLVIVNVYDGNYQEALDRLSSSSADVDNQWDFLPGALRRAQIYGYMKKEELAKDLYNDARIILESKIQEQPQDDRFHSSLGIAYAGLGRKEEAIREGKRGVELLPIAKEAWRGADRVEDLARIYVMVGEFDAAIDQLEFLLSIPSEMSVPLLRLDSAWDPLRNHPRFKKLLESEK